MLLFLRDLQELKLISRPQRSSPLEKMDALDGKFYGNAPHWGPLFPSPNFPFWIWQHLTPTRYLSPLLLFIYGLPPPPPEYPDAIFLISFNSSFKTCLFWELMLFCHVYSRLCSVSFPLLASLGQIMSLGQRPFPLYFKKWHAHWCPCAWSGIKLLTVILWINDVPNILLWTVPVMQMEGHYFLDWTKTSYFRSSSFPPLFRSSTFPSLIVLFQWLFSA